MNFADTIINIFQLIGVVLLGALLLIAIIAGALFFIARKKYYYYREKWHGRRNFFTIVVTPFIEWVGGVLNYAEKGAPAASHQYAYRTKQFVMTKPEHDAFNALMKAVGDMYYVFPQIHLDMFLGSKIPGQNWDNARRHINQKSVDFLLCDKTYLNPKLAIELDDSTHEAPERILRDTEVERVCASANFPLLRIQHTDITDVLSLKNKILNLRL